MPLIRTALGPGMAHAIAGIVRIANVVSMAHAVAGVVRIASVVSMAGQFSECSLVSVVDAASKAGSPCYYTSPPANPSHPADSSRSSHSFTDFPPQASPTLYSLHSLLITLTNSLFPLHRRAPAPRRLHSPRGRPPCPHLPLHLPVLTRSLIPRPRPAGCHIRARLPY